MNVGHNQVLVLVSKSIRVIVGGASQVIGRPDCQFDFEINNVSFGM